MLGKEKATNNEVAIKSVSQEMVAKLGKKRHIFREKNLLNEMDNQFIIKLLGTTMVSRTGAKMKCQNKSMTGFYCVG